MIRRAFVQQVFAKESWNSGESAVSEIDAGA
jgi:hypothetical protein